MTLTEAQEELDRINDILFSGVSTVSHNGKTTSYNLVELRAVAQELRRYIVNLQRGGGGFRNVIYNPRFKR